MNKEANSYKVNMVSDNTIREIKRLKGQVELFWDKEVKRYCEFGLKDGMSVVEFGCGPGYLTEKLLKTFPNINVTGVELDIDLIKYAEEYLHENGLDRYKMLHGSIMSTDFADNTFDFAITRLVLEHLPDPLSAVKEVYRVLKPGGKAVFIDNDFKMHIETYPPIANLGEIYKAYSKARQDEGGNPEIGRQLPVILNEGGFTNIDLDIISAHSSVIGDEAFLESEGNGIPAKLVQNGYLSSKVMGEIAVQWRKLLRSENHAICRHLYIAAGEKDIYEKEEEKLQPQCLEEERSQSQTCIVKKSDGKVKYEYNVIFQILKEQLLGILNISEELLCMDSSFSELGISSLQAVDLIDVINDKLDIELGVEAIYDYRGIKELASYITCQFGDCESIEQVNDLIAADLEKTVIHDNSKDFGEKDSEVAIIGISGKFAGADNVNEFWDNLCQGRNSVEEISREEWCESEYYNADPEAENKSISKWGGLLKDIDKFDPNFFNISPREAEMMDPQQRIFLEEGLGALEDSGYPAKLLSGKNVGVFVGARSSDYLRYALSKENINAYMLLGNDISILSARISYYLNLKGPNLTVDTACSSSLVAIHLACESIRRGESEMALAGGVFVMSTPEFYIMASKTNMLSPDGKCKTFDNTANGIVVGEGAGVVVLKRLKKAIADGDHIYGVIKGSAINQDGRTNGITAPSMVSQENLITNVYEKAGVSPEKVSYIEAHGTGTKLGDPIEVKALTKAFSAFTDRKKFCAIGSHKPNIGHTITSAGIAGVLKILMGMKHKMIAPTINITKPNEHIDFENSPFYVNTELRKWEVPGGEPRIAGISSFGFSGTNCHLVIEEYNEVETKDYGYSEKDSNIIVLSAKNEKGLISYARNLANYLKTNIKYSKCTLSEIAYTLQCRREAMSVRLAVVVNNIDELINELDLYCDGKNSTNLYRGFAKENVTLKDMSSFDQDGIELDKLAQLWVSGIEIDWQLLYSNGIPKHISLPILPFVKERYWVTHTKRASTNKLSCEEIVHNNDNQSSSDNQQHLQNDTFKEGAFSQELLTNYLITQIQQLLKMPEPPKTSDLFFEIGLDSLVAVEMRNILLSSTGMDLEPDIVFYHDTIEKLSRYLFNEMKSQKKYKEENNELVLMQSDKQVGVLTLNDILKHSGTQSLHLDPWIVRPATVKDVESLSQLEREEYGWMGEEAIAPYKLIESRIELLNSGNIPWFWVLERDGQIFGWNVLQPTSIDFNQYKSWAEATDQGKLKATFDPNGSAVYIVASGISGRINRIADQMITLQMLLTVREAGINVLFSCLSMPGFAEYYQSTGKSPEQYLARCDKSGIPLDSFISLAASKLPVKPSFRFLENGYPPDLASHGHGVSAVFKIDNITSAIESTYSRIIRASDMLGIV